MICQLCARHLAVPAVRRYVDPDGYVWWFCQRHGKPLERREQRVVNAGRAAVAP